MIKLHKKYMNRQWMRAVLGTALLWSGAAAAVNTEGYEAPYLFGGGLYEFGDSKRDSDEGLGGHLGIGLPIEARPGEALEFSVNLLRRDRDSGGTDDQRSIFGHWVRDLGGDWTGGIRPFVLLGAGAVQEDVAGDDHVHFGLDAGLGALLPLPYGGWALRAETIAQAQLNDDSVPDEDVLFDVQLKLGLQIPLGGSGLGGGRAEPAPDELPPEPVCDTRVVDPVTGKAECITDSDRDGVRDSADHCPSTPSSIAVDAKGCTIVGVVDSDGDGVVDPADACPGSTVGMAVDATGCLVEQTVTLKAVQFQTGSAQLMPDARIALNEVARTLKNQRNLNVEISGHTDNVGNDGFNLLLSQQRAESVRQHLIGKGVAAERLVALGLGETQPVADNNTEEGREANRRVEFKVSVQQ